MLTFRFFDCHSLWLLIMTKMSVCIKIVVQFTSHTYYLVNPVEYNGLKIILTHVEFIFKMLRRKAKLQAEGIVTDAFQDTSGVSKLKVKKNGAQSSLTEEQQLEELVFGHQPFTTVSNFSNLT